MSDLLLDIVQKPIAKRLIRHLRLPIPIPEPLAREETPWCETPLDHAVIALGGKKNSPLLPDLRDALTSMGAHLAPQDSANSAPLWGLVMDATTLQSPEDLGGVYDFFKPRLGSLQTSGRVVIVGRALEACKTLEEAALAQALSGFVKSLAKEVGRQGATCQLLRWHPEATPIGQWLWPLAYLLSRRSAYVSGQTITLGAGATTLRDDVIWTSPLQGKTALVTGAARGIGLAIACHLAREGARVVGLDHPTERTALTTAMVDIQGLPMVVDLLAPGAAAQVISQLETDIGGIDILVHNAGITRDKTLRRMPRDFWDDTVAINFKIPMDLTAGLVLHDTGLIRLMNPHGRVIFISSITGLAGNFGQTNYAAAKAGLLGYVGSLAPVVASRGITVNAVAPGFIDTPMTQKMPLGMREIARRMNALGQGGQPEDVAEAVTFLAAPGAAALTGQVLRVCGLNMLGA